MSNDPRCPGCNARHGFGHAPNCGALNLKQLREVFDKWLIEASAHRLREHNRHVRLQGEIIRWQGKFLMVKQENNALRRKLKQNLVMNP